MREGRGGEGRGGEEGGGSVRGWGGKKMELIPSSEIYKRGKRDKSENELISQYTILSYM